MLYRDTLEFEKMGMNLSWPSFCQGWSDGPGPHRGMAVLPLATDRAAAAADPHTGLRVQRDDGLVMVEPGEAWWLRGNALAL